MGVITAMLLGIVASVRSSQLRRSIYKVYISSSAWLDPERDHMGESHGEGFRERESLDQVGESLHGSNPTGVSFQLGLGSEG
jgi:hypothetical protein